MSGELKRGTEGGRWRWGWGKRVGSLWRTKILDLIRAVGEDVRQQSDVVDIFLEMPLALGVMLVIYGTKLGMAEVEAATQLIMKVFILHGKVSRNLNAMELYYLMMYINKGQGYDLKRNRTAAAVIG